MCNPKKCSGCIQIYHSIGGWKSRLMKPVGEDGVEYCDVWMTGRPCKTSAEARVDGMIWAESEGIPFKG